jgi:glycerol-3-phosphate dehydrogenase subunit B
MKHDLIIVGAGLAGLFAANLAADQGLNVHVISKGRGGLSLSHGCIDLYRTSNPSRSIKSLPHQHPYKIIPRKSIQASISIFRTMVRDVGLEYQGGISSSIPLLSALGTPFRTSLVPRSMFKGRLDDSRPLSVAGFSTYRDFWATHIGINARRNGVHIKSILNLPLLPSDHHRDLYATDIALLLQDQVYREELWRTWKPKLTGIKRIGVPAVLGFDLVTEILAEAEEYLGIDLFEIATLPPSLPGLRLENALRRKCHDLGVQFTEGPQAIGRIDGRSKGKRAAGIQLETVGHLRSLEAKNILLATGGFLHGGLQSIQEGHVIESVFGIPIDPAVPREEWTSKDPLKSQGYSYVGLATDKFLRPLDRKGKPFLENVFAVGGLLAGADRTYEGSRQGIDLASSYHAIQSIRTLNG